MVVCKYYQQGTCRYGQSCRFDHTNNFGRQGNEKYGESKSVVLGVAEEVLTAERGGQWPLSCFGPFKEQPSIPGFEDVSPEEVRWEMYQAQKNNTVEQTKQQFQQLCQDAISRRNVLKNPTRETAAMLEKLQKGTTDSNNSFLRSTLFTPPANSSSSIFGASQSNPFTTRNFTPTTNSLFASSTATSTSSIFGTKPFGMTKPSLFGGANTQQAPFAAQSGQNIFGAAPAGTNTAPSIFGAANTANTANANTFGNTFTSTAPTNLFTSSSATPAPGIFSNTLNTSSTLASNTLFGQTKNTAAFGGAPVFGSTSTFGNTGLFNKPNTGVFSTNTGANTFGTNTGGNTANSTFGGNTGANTFGTNTGSNTFGTNTAPNAFGANTGSNTFANNTGSNTFAPNTGANTFGNGQNTFFSSSGNSPPTTNFSTPFSQPFNTGSNTFGINTSAGGEGAGGNTTTTTANTGAISSNPFAPTGQTFANNPFGTGTVAGTGTGTGPFGTSANIDTSCYTPMDELTEEEKNIYSADKFLFKKVPLRPPSIEIR
ncbi:nuclear pore complex protein DDB_G0274915-like [Microplitis mediator]|uniref:nuclear pore complex protein DDB_G0274915-like n=1 Tax=Microplitis mediator TaxID=375433 RepID=UPI002553C1B3|nr:nuclear pore complex protein DDB_G0274915-like [Microplitis mediator]